MPATIRPEKREEALDSFPPLSFYSQEGQLDEYPNEDYLLYSEYEDQLTAENFYQDSRAFYPRSVERRGQVLNQTQADDSSDQGALEPSIGGTSRRVFRTPCSVEFPNNSGSICERGSLSSGYLWSASESERSGRRAGWLRRLFGCTRRHERRNRRSRSAIEGPGEARDDAGLTHQNSPTSMNQSASGGAELACGDGQVDESRNRWSWLGMLFSGSLFRR